VLTLGTTIVQFQGGPQGPVWGGELVPRSPPVRRGGVLRRERGLPVADAVPPRVLVYVGGQRLSVPGGRMALNLHGLRLPLPAAGRRAGALTYLPLRLSLQGDAQGAWQASAGAELAHWPRPVVRHEPVRPPVQRPAAVAPAPRPDPPAAAPPPAPVLRGAIPYTEADVLLIAHVVHSEAAGQPWDARLGVAAVIVNRVRAPGYPKTVSGVVFDPGQFDGVGTAMFYATPDAEDVQAATEALSGVDPTGGALYFYNPALTPPGSPMFDLPVVATFGALRFAR
jgi:spore germination cell wall hydrolase CwlJ-like protein